MKNKPQSFEEYSETFDSHTASLMYETRSFIMKSVPGMEENIKWGVPFYSYLGNVCFINTTKKEGYLIEIGFYRGKELSNKQKILEGDTKLIKKVFLRDKSDLGKKKIKLIEVIQEAVMLNELGPLKLPKPRKKYY